MKTRDKVKLLSTALIRSTTGTEIKDKIFYLHISKCGGTSLRHSIASNYGLPALLKPDNIVYLNSLASAHAALKLDRDIYSYRDELLGYYMSHPSAKFITGHFSLYGKSCLTLSDGWKFITMLREPIERFISAYHFNKYAPSYSNLYDSPSDVAIENNDLYVKRVEDSLEDFLLTEEAIGYGNDFVRQTTYCDNVDYSVTDDHIQASISSLENFSVVGLLEYIDIFTKDFYDEFGVKLKLPHLNKGNKASKKIDGIPENIVQKIRDICKPNLQVYEHFVDKLTRNDS